MNASEITKKIKPLIQNLEATNEAYSIYRAFEYLEFLAPNTSLENKFVENELLPVINDPEVKPEYKIHITFITLPSLVLLKTDPHPSEFISTCIYLEFLIQQYKDTRTKEKEEHDKAFEEIFKHPIWKKLGYKLERVKPVDTAKEAPKSKPEACTLKTAGFNPQKDDTLNYPVKDNPLADKTTQEINIHRRPTANATTDAMRTVIQELRLSKEPGSYYHSWQCNIAQCFMSEFDNELLARETFNYRANRAAKAFLDLLIQ
ncbi:MAG: hypothetical protein HOP31_12980 [Ignavibacteria bacterium]|nr:hypothetical protein [Ignavibacteria bacterium]